MSALNQPPKPQPGMFLSPGQKDALTIIASGFKRDPEEVLEELTMPGTIFVNREWRQEAREAINTAERNPYEMKHGLVIQIQIIGAKFTGDRTSELNFAIGSWVLDLLSEHWRDYTNNLQERVDMFTKR